MLVTKVKCLWPDLSNRVNFNFNIIATSTALYQLKLQFYMSAF